MNPEAAGGTRGSAKRIQRSAALNRASLHLAPRSLQQVAPRQVGMLATLFCPAIGHSCAPPCAPPAAAAAGTAAGIGVGAAEISARGKDRPARPRASSHGSSKLLEQVRTALRVRQLSFRTGQAYVYWGRPFILQHQKRHSRGGEIQSSLSHLAVDRAVAPTT